MSQDLLLELSRHPQARQIIKAIGLPVPPALARPKGPYLARPLEGSRVALCSREGSALLGPAGEAIIRAGGAVCADDEAVGVALAGVAEAYGRPVGPVGEEGRVDALVFDADGVEDTAGLRALYDFFHPLVRRVAKGGRIVVIGRPVEEATSATGAAARAALEGFVRSLAKEIGKKGATAQLLTVGEGAEDRLAGPLRFFLSARSAYISGQPLHVSASVSLPERVAETRPLDGKVALVTGAARGIGEATARRLAEEGARVVCLDLPNDRDRLARLADSIHGVVLAADLTAPETPLVIAQTLAGLGGADVVVHNAGITRDKTLARMKPELWDFTVDVNLRVVERVNAALVDEGALNEHARVVCLSSVAGIAGNMGQTNYSASKSGLLGYVRHLAPELAASQATINAIAPGFIETRLTDAIPVAIREVGRRMNNLSQGGRPIDVAEAITFLCLPQSAGVTGQTLRVCGGMMIGA